MQRRIAVIGPESTGKSTLCEQLAEHYDTLWVPEYAREHLHNYGLRYTYDDLLHIARKQAELEDRIAMQAGEKIIFADTNMYVMKVWCEFVFDRCHHWILEEVVAREYDLLLLCDIDLPWEFQEMREYPEVEPRQRLFHMYKDIVINQHIPWAIISGTDRERLQSAINAVESLN